MSLSSTDLSTMPWSLMASSDSSTKTASSPATSANKTTSVSANRSLEKNDMNQNSPDGTLSLFGEDGFTFADMLDIINPLQHLPVIAPIYRELTGDNLDPGARLAGDTLFGGPIGLATGLLNTAVEAHSGTDIGGNILSFFTPDDDGGDSPKVQLAQPAASNPVMTKLIAEPELRATAAPVVKVDVSKLTQPTVPAAPVISPPEITQPTNLGALQLQISTQMAQQIAEASARQISPPIKAKPEPKPDIMHDKEPSSSVITAPTSLVDRALSSETDIADAMNEALEKYERLYANPG